MKNIVIIYNTTNYVIKFRLPLIKKLQDLGYKISVISPLDESSYILKSLNIEHFPVEIQQYGMNPFVEIKSLFQIWTILKKIKPLVALNYTAKPNTIGSLAAWLGGVPYINNIAGSGMIFTSGGRIARTILSALYKISLRNSHTVFFQNGDDMELFLNKKLVKMSQCRRLPGSGVDIARYVPTPLPSNKIRFLFIGRLLKLKGIEEYLISANSILHSYNGEKKIEFYVVGELENSSAFISQEKLNALTNHSQICYLGSVHPEDIGRLINEASCIVLPTYYGEGVPRVLLEAIASARPIITTDNPGSRDVVEHELNGYMIKPRSVASLTEALERFIYESFDIHSAMGKLGRKKAEQVFDERFVIDHYIERIEDIVKNSLLSRI